MSEKVKMLELGPCGLNHFVDANHRGPIDGEEALTFDFGTYGDQEVCAMSTHYRDWGVALDESTIIAVLPRDIVDNYNPEVVTEFTDPRDGGEVRLQKNGDVNSFGFECVEVSKNGLVVGIIDAEVLFIAQEGWDRNSPESVAEAESVDPIMELLNQLSRQ
jgi:hypothetical protein